VPTSSKPPASGYQFGTFKGVFTPSILTILGVVMYLRLGWVLGHLGLPMTLLTVTLASSITLLTGFSLAALATNMRVGGGGAYFIISRSLGIEAGAAIGLPLYLAQTLGISFYIVGFSESFVGVFPQFDPHIVGVATLAALGVLVTISADLALKSQFFIMAAIGASLLSFFLGSGGGGGAPAAPHEMPDTLPFWTVFAVFFPAVTGIEAGIAMSGDLKNPARSLPVGTLAAVFAGWAIYVAIAVFLDRNIPDRALLLDDPLVMEKAARWGKLVILGIWAASLSSALGALLGAPRTMQALARDRVLPRVLGKGFGKGNDPRIATGVAFAISLAGVLLGDLNLIAPVLSMFFLTSYGMLNLSAGMEEVINPASWRPTFRVPAFVSLTGAFACLCVMIMIAPAATVAAVLICTGIYAAMKRRSMKARWGDMRVGALMFLAREVLHRINRFEAGERNWQPNLLVLTGAPATRWHLVRLADAISRDRCFVTIAAVVPQKQWTTERAEKLRATMREFLLGRKIRAFVRAFPAPSISEGARQLVRAYGFGPIVPNTILLGITTGPDSFTEFTRLALLAHRTRRNLIVLRRDTGDEDADTPDSACDPSIPVPEFDEQKEKRIDVWWRGNSPHAALMLTVAHLLTRSRPWRKATLRIRTVADDEPAAENARTMLEEFIAESRIHAEPDVVVRAPDQSPFDAIREATADCSLVFLGLQVPGEDTTPDEFRLYYRDLMEQTRGLPTTAFVMASENVDFTRIVGPAR
jgi:amino acid transporter